MSVVEEWQQPDWEQRFANKLAQEYAGKTHEARSLARWYELIEGQIVQHIYSNQNLRSIAIARFRKGEQDTKPWEKSLPWHLEKDGAVIKDKTGKTVLDLSGTLGSPDAERILAALFVYQSYWFNMELQYRTA